MRLIDADALIAQMKADAEQMEEPIAKMFTYAAINDVKHAPTIEPEQKWIPVSKKFPDTPGMYTVTDSKGDVVRFVFYCNESTREYWERCAKAWMPLPKPYGGEPG